MSYFYFSSYIANSYTALAAIVNGSLVKCLREPVNYSIKQKFPFNFFSKNCDQSSGSASVDCSQLKRNCSVE